MLFINKKVCLVIPAFLSVLSAQVFSSELKTNIQKESYSIGVSTGNYVVNQIFQQKQLGIKTDMNLVLKGFKDALINKQELTDEQVITELNNRAELLNKLQKEQFEKLQKDNLEKEKKYLEKNSKAKDVKVTKSGLQYQVLKQGNGKEVKPESIVILNYKASLLDGYVFDDTYARKAPAHLSMINVIDGLKEGLLMMKEGAKYKFVIPSKLGYGNVQMRDIPPNSPLIFEVELLKVLKPGALKEKQETVIKEQKVGK